MPPLTNFLLGTLPHYTRKARHLHQLLRHCGPRKLVNLLSAEWALRTGRTQLSSMPYIYIIDPCNVCNLRCPLCPTGNQTADRPKRMMSLECYRSIIDQVRDYAIEVILHNWGESLLHPKIFDMISYAHDANIGTSVSSHLNGVTDDMIEHMIDSGLEHLTASIDGATQGVYEQYRVRGSLAAALSAIERLQRRKRERRSRTPILEWQFIVMKHNERARSGAQGRPGRAIPAISVGLPFDDLTTYFGARWMSDNPAYRGYDRRDDPARLPVRRVLLLSLRSKTINPDGAVASCCAISHTKCDFGSIHEQSVREIWNSPRYQSARSLFSDHPIAQTVNTVCDGCPLYRQRKHRERERAGAAR
jgi:radical SAM protein with 4Fe4S-binding SPASM domain